MRQFQASKSATSSENGVVYLFQDYCGYAGILRTKLYQVFPGYAVRNLEHELCTMRAHLQGANKLRYTRARKVSPRIRTSLVCRCQNALEAQASETLAIRALRPRGNVKKPGELLRRTLKKDPSKASPRRPRRNKWTSHDAPPTCFLRSITPGVLSTNRGGAWIQRHRSSTAPNMTAFL